MLDAHYHDVADVYRMRIATGTHAPAQELAKIFRIPITTANRWVKEARRRGILEPATTHGRAGPPRCSCRCAVHCPKGA